MRDSGRSGLLLGETVQGRRSEGATMRLAEGQVWSVVAGRAQNIDRTGQSSREREIPAGFPSHVANEEARHCRLAAGVRRIESPPSGQDTPAGESDGAGVALREPLLVVGALNGEFARVSCPRQEQRQRADAVEVAVVAFFAKPVEKFPRVCPVRRRPRAFPPSRQSPEADAA